MEALRAVQERVGFRELLYDSAIGKISIVWCRDAIRAGRRARFFDALAEVGVNIGRARVFPDQPERGAGLTATLLGFRRYPAAGRMSLPRPGCGRPSQVCAIGPMVTNRDPGMRSQPLADRLYRILCRTT